jgi:hypothetical protein
LLPDADIGSRADACRRLRRLSQLGRQDWSDLTSVMSPRPIVFVTRCRPEVVTDTEVLSDRGAILVEATRRLAPRMVCVGLLSKEDVGIARALSDAGIAVSAGLLGPADLSPQFARPASGSSGSSSGGSLRMSWRDFYAVAGEGTAERPNGTRTALRLALGIMISYARLYEAPCILIDIDRPAEPLTVCVPGGAVSRHVLSEVIGNDCLPSGFSAAVMVEYAKGEGLCRDALVDLKEPPHIRSERPPGERQELHTFNNVADAVQHTFAMLSTLKRTGRSARLCCDVVAGDSDEIATSRLCRFRPAIPENEVFVTESFIAECALLKSLPAEFQYAGRIRSLDRRGRLALWSLAPFGQSTAVDAGDLALAS